MTDMETLESNRQLELHFPMMENEEYQKAQDQEIQLGIEQGLDVSLYKNPEFNWLQMEQIRLGLRDKIDASGPVPLSTPILPTTMKPCASSGLPSTQK